jgi:hypothetical protein
LRTILHESHVVIVRVALDDKESIDQARISLGAIRKFNIQLQRTIPSIILATYSINPYINDGEPEFDGQAEVQKLSQSFNVEVITLGLFEPFEDTPYSLGFMLGYQNAYDSDLKAVFELLIKSWKLSLLSEKDWKFLRTPPGNHTQKKSCIIN